MSKTETRKEQAVALRQEERPNLAEMREMERERPRVRGDCIDGPRPCPWISCRYHLGVDVKASGGIVVNYGGPNGPTGDGKQPTCALDEADRKDLTLDAIGNMLGITREAVRHIEVAAIRKLKDGIFAQEEKQSCR